MLPTHSQLRSFLARIIDNKTEQGHDVDGLRDELDGLPSSLDALAGFGRRLSDIGLRDDWPYDEPDEIDSIRVECDPNRALGPVSMIGTDEAERRIRAAFLGRVCGCMLGKPFEVFVTLDEIRAALQAHDEWPLVDYPTEAALRSLPALHGQWRQLTRESITHVAPDDDINYTILAMLALERGGADFTQDHLKALWLYNLPVLATFGPERTFLLASGVHTLGGEAFDPSVLNPDDELCGALIRADAYGYAAIGRPELAASLAHRDASMTHRRTGVYGPMFVAAAIALVPFVDDPLDAATEALRYVPQRSRFVERTTECIEIVRNASDWLTGYGAIRTRFGNFGFCRIYQEIGTVINTLRFSSDVGTGICLQVMQGNDTDSFAATAGSLLGAFHGEIEPRWYEPFGDEVHTALANFHERSLEAITDRMAALPGRVGR